MSTQDHTDDQVPHPRYTATKRKAFGSQRAVANAWAEGQFPTHNVDHRGRAILYSSPNFEGRQNPDGSGELRHYRSREAIRTINGLVIRNRQCWSAGFAHCSPPRDSDHTLPLDAVENLLENGDSVYDIVEVVEGDGREKVVVLDGYGIAVGYDPSILDHNERRFGFRIDADAVERARDEGPRAVICEALTPDVVRESDLEIVDSSDFTKTRLDEAEARAHVAAGGTLTESNSRWRDRKINRQQFRADLQGEVIVRHGEWFFVPVDDVQFTTASRKHKLPKKCSACGESGFDVDARSATCKACGHLHVVPSGDLDRRLGNHRPREAVYAGDDTFVRGQVRHGDNDHNAINLGEKWHKAVTHDRDVTVFDTSGGRGRRGARMD